MADKVTCLRVPRLPQRLVSPANAAISEAVFARAPAGGSVLGGFGTELRAAFIISRTDREHDRIFQRFISRPACEPILLLSRTALTADAPSFEELTTIAGGLSGGTVRLSVPQMRTSARADGSYTLYAPVDERRRWPEFMAAIRSIETDPISRAALCYAVTILCHPLEDGNGRASRAYAWGSLVRDEVMITPHLPMGPVFFRHREVIINGLSELSRTGCWVTLAAALGRLFDAANRLHVDMTGGADAPQASVA